VVNCGVQTVADSDQYFKLTSRQMASMLAENSLRVNSEYRLFELVLKWIKNDREGRQPSVAALMNNVRLPLLSGEELVEKVIFFSVYQINFPLSPSFVKD
jgi:kelch-like protein 9/13